MRAITLFITALMICAAPILFSAPATAQQQEPDNYVQWRALAEMPEILAGEDIWIAVEQDIYPQWHTYWRNPGDSGSPTRIEWDLPAGFEVSEIHWPLPHKLPYGPLLNYGYEGRIALLQKLSAPDILPDGPVTLTARTEALVCKDICIPEFSSVSLTLNKPGNATMPNYAYFERAQDKLPSASAWPAYYTQESGSGNDFVLEIETPFLCTPEQPCDDLELFPHEWGLVDNTADARIERSMDKLIIKQTASPDRDITEVPQARFLVAYNNAQGAREAFEISGALVTPPAAATSAAAAIDVAITADISPDVTLAQALLFALLGGIILNLMPCVFPVLSLKALSLVKIAEKQPGLARMHGLSYTAGIILSFLAIAGVLIALKSVGAEIGWGFQLQNPLVVGLLAYLLFVIGLNLSGLFDVGGNFANTGQTLTQKSGLGGSFFTGILATLVATPCTAPFMAAALGYALVQPAVISLGIFAALGLGLALPYLALSFIPALDRLLPKPGAWMDTFKQLLAFPMFASAAWLVWVLSQQAGTMGVLSVLMGMVALAFGIWLWRHLPAAGFWRFLLKLLAIAAIIAPFIMLPRGGDQTSAIEEDLKFGEAFSPAILQQALASDAPVFVEITAAWCITCKLNHAVGINIAPTKNAFANNNVRFLVGDWTNYDPAITDYLHKFDREGVPLYVFYAAPDANGQRPAPQVLPQILTPGTISGLF